MRLAGALWLAAALAGRSATIWTGPTVTFSKAAFTDPTLAVNQDRMTTNVWITRGSSTGLYNARTEVGYTVGSPADTEWANGTTADLPGLAFADWDTWAKTINGGPPLTVGRNAVVHLIRDDVYVDIMFTSWADGHSSPGGAFSYQRSTPAETNTPPGVITNPITTRIPKGSLTIELQTVADGMAAPLGMAVPDDGSGRMFVYDQDGHVWVVTASGVRLPTPLLDVSSRLVQLGAYDERGLLGLAAHTNFSQFPLIYTCTSEPANGVADFPIAGITNDHQAVIAEWRINLTNSNTVDTASRREVLRIDQPAVNHNGGTMRFGPDGLLYVALGDGGLTNDAGPGHVSGGNAQSLNVILGKIIRIDVSGSNSGNGKYGIPPSNPFVGTNALPEVYAYGLRNPFGYSFDRLTGRLCLGDTGQNHVEEVDVIASGGNYGWNLREGGFWFDPATGNDVTAPVSPPPTGMIDPIAQYGHDDGLAVIGGGVYRGSAIPALSGVYVFGDWGSFAAASGRLFYLNATNGVNELRIGGEDRPLGLWLRGFGEGPDGELYAFGSRWLGPSGSTGRMLKIVPAPSSTALTVIASLNGVNITPSWTGGAGPFALQMKNALGDSIWVNAAVTNQRSATVTQDSPAAFYRVRDAGHLSTTPLTVYMTGAAERPTPNGSAGIGTGIFALDGNTLTFNIRYGGLSGIPTDGHIHGPSSAAGSAGVIIGLGPYNGGAWGTSGTISGVMVLTDTQKAYLLAGQTYLNLHTPNYPAGEIRGQIIPVNLQVALDGAKEPGPVATPANGLGNLMLVGNQLTVNLTYRNLTGAATGAHIHGPASATGSAGVIVDLSPISGGSFGASGSLSGTVTLTRDELAWLVDGLTYVNFHTLANPGGEIRGQIRPHCTAVPLTVLLSGLAERPTSLINSAAGNGALSLEGNTLIFNILYSGLTGTATGAHVHGVTNTVGTADVIVDLSPFNGGGFGSSGTISGSVNLTADQRNAVLGGLAYVNVLTAANPGGEIRGQIAPVSMSAALNGVNERDTPVATPASALGTFALVRDQLALALTYRGFTNAVTASHIHGPAGLLGTAGVLFDLATYTGGTYGLSGGLSGTAPLGVTNLLYLIDGGCYVNLHTTINPGGEIRGQILR